MSSARRSSRAPSAVRRRNAEPPPKKSSPVPLILTIVVMIVLFAVVGVLMYLLWRRPSTNTTIINNTGDTNSGCTSNSDCTGGKLCNAVTGNCVGCFNDTNCSGSTPVCDLSTATCVEGCLSNSDCSGATPKCNISTKTCEAGCVSNTDCPIETPICKTDDSTCVKCIFNTDCTGISEVCSNGDCVPGCFSNADCSFPTPACDLNTNLCVNCVSSADCFPSAPACDLATQSCVECTSNANCGGSTPLCRPATKTCVGCITNANCGGSTPICGANFTCVECATDGDCTNPETCGTNNICCIESTQAPAVIFYINSIQPFPNMYDQPVAMYFHAEFSQTPSHVRCRLVAYDDANPTNIIRKSAFFTPTPDVNNNIAIAPMNFDQDEFGNDFILFGGAHHYRWAIEVNSGCGTWTELKDSFFSFSTSNYRICVMDPGLTLPSFNQTVLNAAARTITFSYPDNINQPNSPSIGIGVKFGTSAHVNDYEFVVRNVTKTWNGLRSIWTFQLPPGPPITPGTLCDVRMWVDNACYNNLAYYQNLPFA